MQRSTPRSPRRTHQELRGEVHLDRGRARVALGNPAAARAELDSALQLVPTDAFAWYLSAALARRENDLARAGGDIARARELSPDNPDVLLLAGTIAGQAGNMDEAYALYRRMVTIAPDSDAGRRQPATCASLGGALAASAAQDTGATPPTATPAPAPAQPPPQPR